MRSEFRSIMLRGVTHAGLPDLAVPGARVAIRLDPEDRLVFAWRDPKPPSKCGTLLLGFVESNTVIESLEDWFDSHNGLLEQLCDAHAQRLDHALDLQKQVMQHLMHAEAESLSRWLTPDQWLMRKGRTQIQVADEAIAIGDLDGLVETEIAAALSENVCIDRGMMTSHIRQILVDERSEIEDDWPEDDPEHLYTRSDLHRRLHQLRLVLGETHPQPEPHWIRDSESTLEFGEGDICGFQRRIVTGIRKVTPEDITRVRMALRGQEIERPLDMYPLYALLSALCQDTALRVGLADAMAQVRQAMLLEEHLKEQ